MYYPCSENKGADQLRGYREADLRLCFRLCRLLVFPRGGSNISSEKPIHAISEQYFIQQASKHTAAFGHFFSSQFSRSDLCTSLLDLPCNNVRAASWENQQCGFRTGLTQTGLYSYRSRLEA